jgi:hypothetical protein
MRLLGLRLTKVAAVIIVAKAGLQIDSFVLLLSKLSQ